MFVFCSQGANDDWTETCPQCSSDIHARLHNYIRKRMLSVIFLQNWHGKCLSFAELIRLLGRHFRGRISLGTEYASGTVAKPKPMSVCAAITRYMFFEVGAIAAPMKERAHEPTKMLFRAWKTSEAEEMTWPITACTRDSAFGIHVCCSGLSKSSPIYSN